MTRMTMISVACAMAMVAGVAWAHEQEVKLADAPAAVQQAVKQALGRHQLAKLTRDTEDGQTIYEAQYAADGSNVTVSVTEAGKVVENERTLDVVQLPDVVAKAVAAKYPKAKITKAELSKVGDTSTYEVTITDDAKEQEIRVAPDGQIRDSAKQDSEDHDNDKGG